MRHIQRWSKPALSLSWNLLQSRGDSEPELPYEGYISSHAKQENLYAVYETTDRRYWTELAKCNQQEFKKSGAEGNCIEAREFIIALPESIERTATRNMFYGEQGKHVRTKKEILGENGLYLATKKIGKNNPKEEQIWTDNEYRIRCNRKRRSGNGDTTDKKRIYFQPHQGIH